MKTNRKAIIAVAAILVLACTLAFAACDPEVEENNVDKALSLASICTTTSVALSKDGTVYYSYTKTADGEAVVSDPYDTGVTADDFVDFDKEIKSGIKSGDLKVTENYYMEASGAVKLTAEIIDAEKTLGTEATGAVVAVDGNLITNTVNIFKVTYVDSNGYTVEISLS